MKIVIDKEAIIKAFTIALYAVTGGDYSDVKDAVKEVLEKIGYEPYEEKQKGKWIEETDEHLKGMYRCSKCGRRVDGSVLDDLIEVDEDYTIADIYPYCHCGADMGKGEE
jgi:DNA-directed RNA polymerase subunit RPC12/RpoP